MLRGMVSESKSDDDRGGWHVVVAQGQDGGIDDVRDAPLALHGGNP